MASLRRSSGAANKKLPLEKAIPLSKKIPSYEFHNKIKKMYNWKDVSARIEKVYNKVIDNKPKNLL